MSSPSIFDTVNTFNEQFRKHQLMGMLAGHQGKKDVFKQNTDTDKKIKQIYKKAQESIDSWVDKPEGWFAGLKGKVRNLLMKSPTCTSEELSKAKFYTKPFKWLGRTIHNWGESINPPAKKTSAADPYEFNKLDDAEMVRLEKKAKVVKAVAKTCLIAGGILLCGGLLTPLALAAFLFTLPESVALTVIIGCTVLGVGGVGSAISYPFIKNSKAVNEYEAETNKDFQKFVDEVVQKKDGGFNLSRKDVQNGEIFKIFEDWKDSLEKELSKKRLKKLEEERQALMKMQLSDPV